MQKDKFVKWWVQFHVHPSFDFAIDGFWSTAHKTGSDMKSYSKCLDGLNFEISLNIYAKDENGIYD